MIYKNKLSLFYFLNLILWTKELSSGNSFHKLILWNTGYSQFQTLVNDHNCLHIDPGGTLKFPVKNLSVLCQNKTNNFTFLHNDQFHTSYINGLKQIDPRIKEISETKNLISIPISDRHVLFSFGHLNKEQFKQILNHKLKSVNSTVSRNLLHHGQSKSVNSYVSLNLPHHGQPKYLNQNTIKKLSKFPMLITGSQSRKYINHQSTESKFLKIQKKLILKNKWGHLIFETQY